MAAKFISCSVNGCNANAHYTAHGCKGFCNAHYQRFVRYGDPLDGNITPGEALRFIHEVALPYAGDDCLPYPFAKNPNGYGRLWVGGRLEIASRYLCELVQGPPPSPDHDAAHNCGKGYLGCVTPHHLEWKTRIVNVADTLIHGTRNRGERCGTSKITEAQAREVLKLKGVLSSREIAETLGVTRSIVAHIHAGRSWAWLDQI